MPNDRLMAVGIAKLNRRCNMAKQETTSPFTTAEAYCAAHDIRLTPIRRHILRLLFDYGGPVGAYDLLADLRRILGKAEPPTVYRALEFLIGHGLVHRIESLNAYLACPHPDDLHAGQFLICADCNQATELTDRRIGRAIGSAAARAGFKVRRQTVELIGRCEACAAERPD